MLAMNGYLCSLVLVLNPGSPAQDLQINWQAQHVADSRLPACPLMERLGRGLWLALNQYWYRHVPVVESTGWCLSWPQIPCWSHPAIEAWRYPEQKLLDLQQPVEWVKRSLWLHGQQTGIHKTGLWSWYQRDHWKWPEEVICLHPRFSQSTSWLSWEFLHLPWLWRYHPTFWLHPWQYLPKAHM